MDDRDYLVEDDRRVAVALQDVQDCLHRWAGPSSVAPLDGLV
jgi:hypothetical protein